MDLGFWMDLRCEMQEIHRDTQQGVQRGLKAWGCKLERAYDWAEPVLWRCLGFDYLFEAEAIAMKHRTAAVNIGIMGCHLLDHFMMPLPWIVQALPLR